MGKRKQDLGDVPMGGTGANDSDSDDVSPTALLGHLLFDACYSQLDMDGSQIH